MNSGSTGSKSLLTISGCDESGQPQSGGPSFTAMVNPSSLSHQLGIRYDNDKVQGKSAIESKFNQYQQEKLSFELTLDGTGVIPLPQSQSQDVSTQIKQLKDVVYDYQGDEHEPSIVKVQWGKAFSFIGRLNSLSVEYNLFKPNGDPLRAKLKLDFGSYLSNKQESLEADRQSPDLTHRRVVKAGDTLPNLCFQIYKDSGYYLEVAKANGLDRFHPLEPGTTLSFPPLRS
ncbi:peptidoglycan-binding protein [Aliiglaciecola sp. CAU 1673]|uniref:CIS tube protein n=1 Tax=Aliiglaciecola sp. CAU 1673 TaxID=3032595 RepID=UPI0023DA2371|nr:peptidoglycan-binding protein [Aliiglaciecola sp. CAU 1673]MDF2177191.1 peptidoglycan-binding protein [Aliiglaciecola sp. CAU 1673]